ncbi:MAG: PQQ-dependent sugar dehydrogenase, partial [Chloroflexota bacterium]
MGEGFERPTFLTHAGDDRLFVLEQPGRVRVIANGQLLDTPFLDITDVVNDSANEQGLLGLAFHPDYANNGQFFVNYTDATGVGNTAIARYTVSADP